MATSYNPLIEHKELLLTRIKDVEFLDDADEFKCKRCRNVLIHHYISNCGHAFCSNCRNILGDGSCRWKCPECREYVTEIDRQDFEFETRLFDLRVRCANNKYGCPSTFLLKKLGEHLITCTFTWQNALPVEYEPNKIDKVLEQMLTFNRKFDKLSSDIESINEKITTIEINHEKFDKKLKALDNRIDMVNVSLFEQSTKSIEAKTEPVLEKLISTIDEMESRLLILNKKSDWLQEALELNDEKMSRVIHQLKGEFQDDFRNLRYLFQDVLEAKIEEKEPDTDFIPHLKWMEDKIEDNKNELTTLKNIISTTNNLETQIKKIENSMGSAKPHIMRLESFINLIKLQIRPFIFKDMYLNRPADFLWNISDAKIMLKLSKFEIKSEVFRLSEYPFEVEARLKSENGILLPYICFKDTGNELKLQPTPSVYLILRNQSNDRDSDIIRCSCKEFHSSKNEDYTFLGIDKSMIDGFFSNYISNSTLTLEFHVEPPSMTSQAYSYDGTLSWAIENYRKRKERESSRYVMCHESPYFYTGPNGHRVQVRMMLSHMGIGVAADVHFLTGEFDEDIGASFPHKTTVIIVNQKNPNAHVVTSKTQNVTMASSYLIFLGNHGDVENIIENDTLYYHVKIEAK